MVVTSQEDAARRLDALMSYAFSTAHIYKRMRDAIRNGSDPADLNLRYLVGSSTDLTMQTLDFKSDVAPDEELMPTPPEWLDRGAR